MRGKCTQQMHVQCSVKNLVCQQPFSGDHTKRCKLIFIFQLNWTDLITSHNNLNRIFLKFLVIVGKMHIMSLAVRLGLNGLRLRNTKKWGVISGKVSFVTQSLCKLCKQKNNAHGYGHQGVWWLSGVFLPVQLQALKIAGNWQKRVIFSS